MALKRDITYPGRFNAPTSGQPQGAFKNRTSPSSLDGSYFEKQWCNDWSALFSSVLDSAGVTPNGNVDEVGNSQYFQALLTVIRDTVTWEAIPIGVPFPLRVDRGAPEPPINNPNFRYVKLSYNDAYNGSIVTSETISGTAPTIVATGVVNFGGSPMNNKVIKLINTMGCFIRPSETGGVIQQSDNKSHTHTAAGTYQELGFLGPGPGRDFNQEVITTSASGGSESRPYNESAIYYMRIL